MRRFPGFLGAFSNTDADLLRPHLKALIELAEGKRKPSTPLQRQFVKAVNGERPPVTRFEKAFLRWKEANEPDLRQRNAKPESSKNLSSQQRSSGSLIQRAMPRKMLVADQPSITPSGPNEHRLEQDKGKELQKLKAGERAMLEAKNKKSDFKKRKIEEPWGDRAAWKRDRALNKYNGR